MRPDRYILVDREPVPVADLYEWGRWMLDADRHVALSIQGDVRVSTVFLGLDHNCFDDGPPILFETMAFVADDTIEQARYSTWAEAEEGHKRFVAQVFKPTPILSLDISSTGKAS